MKTEGISIVIPTYMEKQNLSPLFSRIAEVFRKTGLRGEVIVVDDDSQDSTSREAQRLAKLLPVRLLVIVRRGERGLATAVLEGIRASSYPFVAVMDADLSHPPELLPALFQKLLSSEADIVVASRYTEGGGTEGLSALRRLLSKLGTKLVSPLVEVTDSLSGYFLFRKSSVALGLLSPSGYKICLEILVKSRPLKAAELPLRFAPRLYGKSKASFGVFLHFLLHVAGLYIYTFRKAKDRKTRLRSKRRIEIPPTPSKNIANPPLSDDN